MRRSARQIWLAAFATLEGFPECGDYMAEPEYASLLFDTYCQTCLEPGPPTRLEPDYALGVRICEDCKAGRRMRGIMATISAPHPDNETTNFWFKLTNAWHGRYPMDPDMNNAMNYYDKLALIKIVRQYRSYRRDREAQANFVEECKRRAKESYERALAIDRWLTKASDAQADERLEKKQKRREEILRRLKDLGHEERDFPCHNGNPRDREWSSILSQPREVTPRVWNNIRSKLEKIVDRNKDRRQREAAARALELRNAERRRQIVEVINDQRAAHSSIERWFALTDSELENLPCTVRLAEGAADVTGSEVLALWPEVNRAEEKHKRSVITDLDIIAKSGCVTSTQRHLVPQCGYPNRPDETIGAKKTASIPDAKYVFTCSACPDLSPLIYPDILDHACPSLGTVWKSRRTRIFQVPAFSTAAANLCKSLGMEGASHKEMLDLGCRIACLICLENVRRPMDWQELLCHNAEEHLWYFQMKQIGRDAMPLVDDHAPEFTKAKLLSVEEAREMQSMYPEKTDSEGGPFHCEICRLGKDSESYPTLRHMAAHVISKHSKQNLEAWHYSKFDQ